MNGHPFRPCHCGSISSSRLWRRTYARTRVRMTSEIRSFRSSAIREAACQVSSSSRKLRCFMGSGGTGADVSPQRTRSATAVMQVSLAVVAPNVYTSSPCAEVQTGIRLEDAENTKAPSRLDSSGGPRDNRNSNETAVQMSVDAILRPRETPVVLADVDHSDLADPRCEVCWKSATFVITTDCARVVACDGCVAERMREAVLTKPSTPPSVTALDVELHTPWGSAA